QIDRAGDAHRHAGHPARLSLEGRAVLPPVDEIRARERRDQRQKDGNADCEQGCLHDVLRPLKSCLRAVAESPSRSGIPTLALIALLAAISCRPQPIHSIATILPGFMMSCGSSARFTERMASSAPAPCSAARYFILPWPMPCSPVHVPPMASARLTSR